MIKLNEKQVSDLLKQPESGMGYQIVEVSRASGIRKGTVYNAELLYLEGEPGLYLSDEIRQRILKTAGIDEARTILSIRVVRPAAPVRPPILTEKTAAYKLGKPATDGEPKKTNDREIFIRFTAYANDRRITADKGLLPGTYATTEADSRNIRTGAEAVERYALPDPTPAKFRFRVVPLKDTVFQEGIVQPANGHDGGGMEIIFNSGTDKNTVSGPAVLPEN